MKAITFLGAGTAYDTAYCMEDGREQTAPYFGAALPHFFPNLSLRVLVTPEARSAHLDRFVQLAEPHVADLEAIDIAGGRTEMEMWQIFETVIDAVDDGEQVIFDITHGFRSLPFLSFLAAAYLRVIKNSSIASSISLSALATPTTWPSACASPNRITGYSKKTVKLGSLPSC